MNFNGTIGCVGSEPACIAANASSDVVAYGKLANGRSVSSLKKEGGAGSTIVQIFFASLIGAGIIVGGVYLLRLTPGLNAKVWACAFFGTTLISMGAGVILGATVYRRNS